MRSSILVEIELCLDVDFELNVFLAKMVTRKFAKLLQRHQKRDQNVSLNRVITRQVERTLYRLHQISTVVCHEIV